MTTMSLADYHRHPAWSPTALKAAVTGTMRAWRQRFGPDAVPFVPSADMVKGDLVDALRGLGRTGAKGEDGTKGRN